MGIQNSISKILETEENSQTKHKIPIYLNPNSMNPMENNDANIKKEQINMNNTQKQPKINADFNQRSEQYNPFSQNEFDINNQIMPQQDESNNSINIINQNNPNVQQQSFFEINPQIINNNDMMNINSPISQIMLQHQFLAIQRMKHQMVLAQIVNSHPQINNILNIKIPDGEIDNPENSSKPINQDKQQLRC